MSDKVKRWVISHMHANGLRGLTLWCQGRCTFGTEAEANEYLQSFLGNNSQDSLKVLYGKQAIDTFRVSEVDCWAGHFDPCGVWVDLGDHKI